jgi:hypothetical protein
VTSGCDVTECGGGKSNAKPNRRNESVDPGSSVQNSSPGTLVNWASVNPRGLGRRISKGLTGPHHADLHFISITQPPPIYGVELSILAVRHCYSPRSGKMKHR